MLRSPQRVRSTRRWQVSAPLVLCVALATTRPSVAVDGPQSVVQRFCQADALGRRVSVRDWPDFMPIVSWPFEPAWDSVVLISGYEVGASRYGEGPTLDVDVRYTVIGQVSALGLDTDVHIETVTFRVQGPEDGGRIVGPPPPPHVFGPRADIEAMRRSFEYGALNFLPNSLFVWQMLRSRGWNVPFQRTADLLAGTTYRVAEEPHVGDVVVYLRDDVPYHAALLEAENQVVSSTVNAGIVRTPLDGFAGDIRYLRLIKPQPAPRRAIATQVQPVPAATPTAVKKPTAKKQMPKGAKRGARPLPHQHVKPAGKVAPRAQRTPVAHGATP